MLNPLIHWEPGTLVHYHGSNTTAHGTYHAHPCTCLNCNNPRLGVVRFELADHNGTTTLTCVRAASITAATDAEDDGHDDCIHPHRDSTGDYVDCTGQPL